MTSSYIILLLFQVQNHSTIIFISQNLVYFDHIASNTSPLGKSDHAVIKWECEVTTLPKMQPVNYNYLRRNYDEMRMFLSRD